MYLHVVGGRWKMCVTRKLYCVVNRCAYVCVCVHGVLCYVKYTLTLVYCIILPSCVRISYFLCLCIILLPVSLYHTQFCNDMWLMFDNAWLYNKKTSKVYKMCTKLYEVFSDHVDNTMKSFGYCCGSKVS